ncbi:hypothetical protein SAMN03097699_1365 [Flavobacteriaceae bacterium MAR_2010_188]|nr:hypothetical protein SAMN03097699_1365 [Flavobacteriaceae bacterium MAR_2010_188]
MTNIKIMKSITSIIVAILLCSISSAYSQAIDKFSIDSGGDTSSSANIQILYTIGEVNIQERSSANLQLSEGFINPQIVLAISLDPKVFLQGPLLNPTIAGLMNDDLRVAAYIPTTSPYADNASMDASVLNVSGNDAIVDWIWVELRDANDNTLIVYSGSALLQRDGDVVGADGVSNLLINLPSDNYFIVLDHRNHLGVMTATALALSVDNVNTMNFTDSAFSTFGSNAQVILVSANTAMWAGDTNETDQIKFSGSGNSTNSIKDYVLADPGNGFNSVTYSSTGYLPIDVDLDGSGKFSGSGNDSNIIKDNVLNHPSNGFGSPTYTISQTVPLASN